MPMPALAPPPCSKPLDWAPPSHLAGGADHRAEQRQRQALLGAVKHQVVGGGAAGQHQGNLVGGHVVGVQRAGQRQRGRKRAAGRGAGEPECYSRAAAAGVERMVAGAGALGSSGCLALWKAQPQQAPPLPSPAAHPKDRHMVPRLQRR